jgi:hypothetical protein
MSADGPKRSSATSDGLSAPEVLADLVPGRGEVSYILNAIPPIPIFTAESGDGPDSQTLGE